jgi:acyl-CoA thioester hydrolase
MALELARPTRAGLVHSWNVHVTAAETALASGVHVHYSIYPRFMDDAVADHLASLGFARLELYTRHHGFDGIRRMEIEYLAPAMEGDDLLVETWVESARGVRLTRGHEISNVATGQVLVRARTEMVWITDAHRPGRWPSELLVALGMAAESGA